MKAYATTTSQNGGAGKFSLQGVRVTSVNAAARAMKDCVSTFECTVTRSSTNTNKQCAVGREQNNRQPEACQASQPREACKR